MKSSIDKRYDHIDVVTLLLKLANDKALLETREGIKWMDKWLKANLPNDSHINKTWKLNNNIVREYKTKKNE